MVVVRLELDEELERKPIEQTVEHVRSVDPRACVLHVIDRRNQSMSSSIASDESDEEEMCYMQRPAPFKEMAEELEAELYFQGKNESCSGREELRCLKKQELERDNGKDVDALAGSSEETWRLLVSENGGYSIRRKGTGSEQGKGDSDWELSNLAGRHRAPLAADLLGITVPMLHRNFLTTRGGWKVNDADLYSVHYLHRESEPRLWYFVHAQDSQEFEYAARIIFPHIFSRCPNFLQHGDIHISPQTLKSSGLKITVLLQSAGEYMIIAPGTYHSFFDLGSNCCESMSFPPTTWQPCPDSSAVCRCGHRLLWEKGYRGFSSLFSGEVRTSTPVLHWGRTVFSLQDPTVPIKHVIPAKPAYASTWSDTANAKEMVDAALEMKSALRVPNGMLEISVEGGISKDSEASVREVPRETTKESRPVKGDFAAVVGRDQESGSNYFYIGQVLNVTADGMATLVWFRKGSDGLFRKENREKWTEHVQSLVPVSLSWVSSKKNSKGGTGGHRLVSPSSKQLLNARVVSAPLTDVN